MITMFRETFLELVGNSAKYQTEFKKLLGELIKHPSVAFREPEGISNCADNLVEILEKFGYQAKLYPTVPDGASVVYGERNVGALKTILFYHHYDVQPEDPLDLWESSPWKLEERNGRLYGRGTADDKGEILISLFGMQLLEDQFGKLPINVKFVIEGEEEAGSDHLQVFTDKHSDLLKADGCIWEGAVLTPEDEEKFNFATPVELVCGLKGDAYFDIKTIGPPKFPRTDVHSGEAAATPNAAWYLVWALSTLKDQNENILIEGINELVQDPSTEDLEVLKTIGTSWEELFKKDLNLEKILLDRSGIELHTELSLKPSLTITGLKSGFQEEGSKTIVPAEASAKLDFRLVPNLTMEKVDELLKQHFQKHGFDDLEVKLIVGYNPSKTSVNHPFIRLLKEISDDINISHPTNIVPIAYGSGPAYLFTPYTPICFVGNAIGGCNGHAPNENIPIKSINSSIAYNAIIAKQLAKEK